MADVEPGFSLEIQCAECPWRTDVPPGQFPPERFKALAHTCRQGWPPEPMFACHKCPPGKEQACVGFLLRNGRNNFAVRLAEAHDRFDRGRLQARGPLYKGFREMAIANGYDPGEDKDFQ